MMAHALHPGLSNHELALPTLLVHDLPPIVGALGLAALFSAEVSSADAILFMLATSLSQDFYKGILRPGAGDAQVLKVARLAAVAGGALGVAIAIVSPSVIGALGIFYTLLSVSLFVPVVAGLFLRRPGVTEALAAIGGGVGSVVALQLLHGGHGVGVVTPALVGLIVGGAAFAVVTLARARQRGARG